MKVLVTGATGYLGRATVGALAARGHAVTAFGRAATASGLSCAAVDGDVRDEQAVREAASGCDAICHLAALVRVWRPRSAEFDEVNVGGLQNVLRAVSRLGLARVVYTSSFMALPPTGSSQPGTWNDYQRTKVLADRVAAEAAARGVPIVRIYPGVIYGPGRLTDGNLVGRSIADHLAGRLPGVVGAACRWSYAYIDDVAEGHAAALERGRLGERYLLCGVNAPQMRVYEIVRALTGRPLPRRIPLAAAALVAAFQQARALLTGREPQVTIGTLRILSREWAFSSDLASRELGYRITPLEEGVARVVSELQGRGAAATVHAVEGGSGSR